MTENVWKHLPYAVYLDTNALRSVGPLLDTPWIVELLTITNEYGITLCISELVLAEWCEHIRDILQSNQTKLLSAVRFLTHYGVQVPDIKQSETALPDRSQLSNMMAEKLNAIGIEIVPNLNVPLSQLLHEAVAKEPPFEHGGKGMCDAVILETYAVHAKEQLEEQRVLVVSSCFGKPK